MSGLASAGLAAAAAGALALGLGGCGSSSLYRWGSYEASVQRLSNGPEGFDVLAEIDRLETDLEKAQNADRAVPPGFHLHLGYLLYLSGDGDGAVHQFEAEKQRFPESAHLVDFLVGKLTGTAAP